MNNYPLEADEQQTLVAWLAMKGLKHSHIANEGKMPVQYRMKLKRLGQTKGVPDMMVVVSADQCVLGRAVLIFIEMKRIGSSPSATKSEQHDWINALNEVKDIDAKVCYGADMAIDFIQEILL